MSDEVLLNRIDRVLALGRRLLALGDLYLPMPGIEQLKDELRSRLVAAAADLGREFVGE